MNQLPFIIAAYALTGIGVVGLGLFSFIGMRRAERQADGMRGEP